MKRCSACNLKKDMSFFGKDKHRPDSHRSKCKVCMSEVYKKVYKKRRDKILKQRKKIREENENKEISSIYKKKCKDCKKDLKAKFYWRDNHKNDGLRSSCIDCIKKHRSNNKEKILSSQRKSWKKRVSNDAAFKLRNLISMSVRRCLSKKFGKKNGATFDYLPYTVDELKEHLQSQFEEWMNWNNWGIYKVNEWDESDKSTWKWNIDHIIPHSNFNYNSLDHPDFKKCWSLENLRPLSAKQNIFDGNRKKAEK